MSTEVPTPRQVIARALYELARAQEPEQVFDYHPEADAALAALTAAGFEVVPRADQWGIRCPDNYVIFRDTDKGQQDWSHHAEVRAIADTWNDPGYVVVRRRPASEWEVAP